MTEPHSTEQPSTEQHSTEPHSTTTEVSDPVLVQRDVVRRRVSLALRGGYGLYLLATVLFFWAIITDFTDALSGAITACLIIGSVLLAPALVFYYGVKAADRADREDSW